MVHQCYPDKCSNVGHGLVCTPCNPGHAFTAPEENEELKALVSVCYIVDIKQKMCVWLCTIVVC